MDDMTLGIDDPVLAVDGVHGREWLQAAYIIVGEFRSGRRARRWIGAVRRGYPGCVVAVARHHAGRWCVLGLPDRTVLLRGHDFAGSRVAELGRLAYVLWTFRRYAANQTRQGA